MDLSSLPEDQRQQLQHLQQLFQEHQLQQQQQQRQIQGYASQAYDPARLQASDQSYYAYYQYQDPQMQYSHNQQQQDYAYYQPDYGNAYQQQAQQHQNSQLEGLPPPQMAEAVGALGQGQNGYFPVQGGDRQNLAYLVPPGLNPAAAAAVAALSQLTQFAGTMEAAERALAMVGLAGGLGAGPLTGPGPTHHGQELFDLRVGPSLPRGGGRRGGRPFRGNGLGNFGNRPSGGTGPPFHGRGRGRLRGLPRQFPPNGVSSASQPKTCPDVQAGLGEEEARPTANNQEEPKATQTSAPKQGNKGSNRQPSQAAYCELCRVDCTSFEMLEQHKNGKRHKKNLQKLEKLQRAGKSVSEMQHEQNNTAESNPLLSHPRNFQEVEDNKHILPENLTMESANSKNKLETEQQNDGAEHPENPVAEQSDAQGRKPWQDSSNDQRRGMKRKMRGGRGGKRMKTVDAPKRGAEPLKPKVVIPLICDLCNVKCDTQEVFDRHLSGKKHISKLKRYKDHQAMYGRVGLQALYPPNPLTQTLLLPHQGPQQVLYGSQGSYPPGSDIPPESHHSTLSATSISPIFQQNPDHQAIGGSAGFDGQTNVPEFQQHSAFVVTEAQQNNVAAQR